MLAVITAPSSYLQVRSLIKQTSLPDSFLSLPVDYESFLHRSSEGQFAKIPAFVKQLNANICALVSLRSSDAVCYDMAIRFGVWLIIGTCG